METFNISSTEAFNQSFFANPSMLVPLRIHKILFAEIAIDFALKSILLFFCENYFTPWMQCLIASWPHTFLSGMLVRTVQATHEVTITALHWVVQQVITN